MWRYFLSRFHVAFFLGVSRRFLSCCHFAFFLGVTLLSFLVSLGFLSCVTWLSFLCHVAFFLAVTLLSFLVSRCFLFWCHVAFFLDVTLLSLWHQQSDTKKETKKESNVTPTMKAQWHQEQSKVTPRKKHQERKQRGSKKRKQRHTKSKVTQKETWHPTMKAFGYRSATWLTLSLALRFRTAERD